jgi:hypothetical protein
MPSGGGRLDRMDLSFESGGRRVLMKSFATKLVPVEIDPEDAKLLASRLSARRTTTGPVKIGLKKKSAGAAASFASFDAQLRFFEAEYPGGLHGEKFMREERAESGAAKKGDKGAASAAAMKALSAEAFAAGDTEQLFAAVTDLVKSTNFVHPLEGAAAVGKMKPEHRAGFISALGALLHGSGDEGARFDRFVSAVQLEESDGSAKRPSWPLVTMFAALVHPDKHICVKPTFVQKQAALARVHLDYQPTPSWLVYEQCLEVARKTRASLEAAGQQPRDLLDVYSFIALTQGAKQPAPVKPKVS